MGMVNINPFWWNVDSRWGINGTNAGLNATGESCTLIGEVYLPGQSGSKTISSAGGAVIWMTGTMGAFSNAGTTLRVGVQDVVTATGLEDATFDVSADVVGGVVTLASAKVITTPMTTGSKTLAHRDLIAISLELMSRGGSDDITVQREQPALHTTIGTGFPYGTVDSGSGPTKTINLPIVMLKFDDGTYGWINSAAPEINHATLALTNSFQVGSTPDEYIGAFKLPVPLTITGIGHPVGSVASADTFELILYSDPFGTPFAERTWTPDPDGLVSGAWLRPSIAPFAARADTWYGVALRPTSANTITWSYHDLLSGNDFLKVTQPFTAIKNASRSNQTGAFTETQAYHLPNIAIEIGALPSGVAPSVHMGI